MTILQLKLISACSITILTSLIGFLQFSKIAKSKSQIDSVITEALAAGIFLAVGLMHMLNDAIKQFSQLHIPYFTAIIIVSITFIALFILEHLSKQFLLNKHSTNSLAIIAASILALHAFFESAALGLTNDFSVVLIIFIAIICHKGAVAFALASQLNKSQLPLTMRIFAFSMFLLMTPLGIFLGNLATSSLFYPSLEPILLSIAAGTFIFLGITNSVQIIKIKTYLSLKSFCFIVIGFGFMALLAKWI